MKLLLQNCLNAEINWLLSLTVTYSFPLGYLCDECKLNLHILIFNSCTCLGLALKMKQRTDFKINNIINFNMLNVKNFNKFHTNQLEIVFP